MLLLNHFSAVVAVFVMYEFVFVFGGVIYFVAVLGRMVTDLYLCPATPLAGTLALGSREHTLGIQLTLIFASRHPHIRGKLYRA